MLRRWCATCRSLPLSLAYLLRNLAAITGGAWIGAHHATLHVERSVQGIVQDLIDKSPIVFAGAIRNAEIWARDPTNADGYLLSDGLEFTVCP